MTERKRGRAAPPPEPPKENPPEGPFYRAARYADELAAIQAYDQGQELIYQTPCDLSAFRLILATGWHVVILGASPLDPLRQDIERLLAAGEPATLTDDILTRLFARRAQASQTGQPWIERHHRRGRGPKG